MDRILDGETVLLDLKSGVYYSLNEAGTVVWNLFAEGATEAELAGALAAEYEVPAEEALRDVRELLKDLCDEGLIVEEAGPAE